MPATQNDAFIDFADRYRGRLLSTARRFLRDAPAAQDVVQDAMLLAVRNLPQFRGDSQMSTWLGRIVINASLTRQRVARRRLEQSLDTLLEQAERGEQRTRYRAAIVTHAPGPERELLNEELRSLLREAIDALRWDYRTVVIQRHYEGASIAAIAACLQITPNAAKLRLIRAHRALRLLLVRRGYDRPVRPARRRRPGLARPVPVCSIGE